MKENNRCQSRAFLQRAGEDGVWFLVDISFFSSSFFPSTAVSGEYPCLDELDLDRADRRVTGVSHMRKSEQGSLPVHQRTGQI